MLIDIPFSYNSNSEGEGGISEEACGSNIFCSQANKFITGGAYKKEDYRTVFVS